MSGLALICCYWFAAALLNTLWLVAWVAKQPKGFTTVSALLMAGGAVFVAGPIGLAIRFAAVAKSGWRWLE